MSTILDKSKLPLALGARVGVIFEVIRIGEPDEQANVTLRAAEPCPGSNYRPEISMHASHCVLLGDGLVSRDPMPDRVNGTPVETAETADGKVKMEEGGGGGAVARAGGGTSEVDPDPVPPDLKPEQPDGGEGEHEESGDGKAETGEQETAAAPAANEVPVASTGTGTPDAA